MFLARSGFRVTVVESGFPGCGVTSAGMGHLVVMDDSDAQFALTRYSLTLWMQAFEDFGRFAEVDHCGTLWVADDEEEMRAVIGKRDYYARGNVTTEVLDAVQLASCEPALRSPMAGALRVPGDSVVYPPGAAVRFLRDAQLNGARILRQWNAISLEKGRVVGERGELHSDVVVNAAGSLAGTLSPSVDIRPRRGHLVITERYPALVRHQIVEIGYLKSAHTMTTESVAFNLQPRATGQLLIGSSRELGVSDSGTNAQILSRMLQRARYFVPGISRLQATRVWTGARPTTADKLPLIGRDPHCDGVWVAAGHEGLGITTSLATGQLLANMITGSATAIDVRPYDPARATRHWH
jgi:glycine/D-amino acid oxidase-like deaminating enzyme